MHKLAFLFFALCCLQSPAQAEEADAWDRAFPEGEADLNFQSQTSDKEVALGALTTLLATTGFLNGNVELMDYYNNAALQELKRLNPDMAKLWLAKNRAATKLEEAKGKLASAPASDLESLRAELKKAEAKFQKATDAAKDAEVLFKKQLSLAKDRMLLPANLEAAKATKLRFLGLAVVGALITADGMLRILTISQGRDPGQFPLGQYGGELLIDYASGTY